MNRPRLIRWLRVAVSAVSVMVCSLSLILWATSYYWSAYAAIPLTHARFVGVESFYGVLICDYADQSHYQGTSLYRNRSWEFELDSVGVTDLTTYGYSNNIPLFRFEVPNPSEVTLTIPYWFLILLSASLAFAPWISWRRTHWRFTTRTLLIVTTLVAVVLGFVVWLVRA